MKISDRDKMLALVLIGIVVLLVSVFVVYPKITAENETMQAEIDSLQSERDQLTALMADKDNYENDSMTMQAELEKMKAQFPAKLYPENAIMDIVHMSEDLDLKVSSVNSSDPQQLLPEEAQGDSEETEGTDIDSTNQDSGEDTSEQDAQNLSENGMQRTTADVGSVEIPGLEEEYVSNYLLYKVTVDTSFETDYNGMKNVISYLKDIDKKNRGVISSLTASFNSESGILTCAASINNFYMEGTDKAYEEPAVPNVDLGVTNLFGTVDSSSSRKSKSSDSDSEESEQGESEQTESTDSTETTQQ